MDKICNCEEPEHNTPPFGKICVACGKPIKNKIKRKVTITIERICIEDETFSAHVADALEEHVKFLRETIDNFCSSKNYFTEKGVSLPAIGEQPIGDTKLSWVHEYVEDKNAK